MPTRFLPIKLGKNILSYSTNTHKTVNNISNEDSSPSNIGSVGIVTSPPPSIPFVREASKRPTTQGGMLLNNIKLKNGKKNDAQPTNLSFVF